jgi:hypothetical protein
VIAEFFTNIALKLFLMLGVLALHDGHYILFVAFMAGSAFAECIQKEMWEAHYTPYQVEAHEKKS